MSEYNEHRAVCQFIRYKYPDVIFTSDGSGVYNQSIGASVKLKMLKSSTGIPDIIILEARGVYHGLMIEMKSTGTAVFKKDGTIRANKHLQEQNDMLRRLSWKGYKAEFAIGLDEAIVLIDEYMKQ